MWAFNEYKLRIGDFQDHLLSTIDNYKIELFNSDSVVSSLLLGNLLEFGVQYKLIFLFKMTGKNSRNVYVLISRVFFCFFYVKKVNSSRGYICQMPF